MPFIDAVCNAGGSLWRIQLKYLGRSPIEEFSVPNRQGARLIRSGHDADLF